jgi:hypothetical protein
VGLERGSLRLVSTIEELLERNSSGSGLESLKYGRNAHHVSPFIRKKLALPLPTIGGRSVGEVRSQTQATEFLSMRSDVLLNSLTVWSFERHGYLYNRCPVFSGVRWRRYATRSRVRFPMTSLFFFSIYLILPVIMPLTELGTEDISWGRVWPAFIAGNITAILKLIVYKIWDPRYITTL